MHRRTRVCTHWKGRKRRNPVCREEGTGLSHRRRAATEQRDEVVEVRNSKVHSKSCGPFGEAGAAVLRVGRKR